MPPQCADSAVTGGRRMKISELALTNNTWSLVDVSVLLTPHFSWGTALIATAKAKAGMSSSIGQLSFSSFLKDTQAALDALVALEKLSITVGLVEQIDDLLDIARCFDDLATTERRNPSVPLKFYSANDLILLQKVVASTEDVLRECHPLVWRIRDSVDEIVIERQQDAYITTEGPLENQALFDEIHLDLRLRTETLKALFKAISLLDSQHVTYEDRHSLEARSRTSTQLHYQIGVVEKELGPGGRHDTYDVWPQTLEQPRAP